MSDLENLLKTVPSHTYLEGNVRSWDIQIGATGNKATIGRIEPGTTAEFTMGPSGEIFSRFDPLYEGSRIKVTIERAPSQSEPFSIELQEAGDVVYLPGGALVIFEVSPDYGPAFYFCEYPGEKPFVANGQSPTTGDHLWEKSRYLSPGDFVTGHDTKVGHRLTNRAGNLDSCVHQIGNIFLQDGDRTLVDVRWNTPEMVYFGNPIKIEVLSGTGTVVLFGLVDDINYSVTNIAEGQTFEIPPGYMSSFCAGLDDTLIIRKTSPDFNLEEEFTFDEYRAVLEPTDKKLINDMLRAVEGDIFPDSVDLQRIGLPKVPVAPVQLGPRVAERMFGGTHLHLLKGGDDPQNFN